MHASKEVGFHDLDYLRLSKQTLESRNFDRLCYVMISVLCVIESLLEHGILNEEVYGCCVILMGPGIQLNRGVKGTVFLEMIGTVGLETGGLK